MPQDQGFDTCIGTNHAGAPASYFYPYKSKGKRKHKNVPGLDNGNKGEYLTDRLTDESISFIDNNKNKPFMLYLSHYAVHKPIQAKKNITQNYQTRLDEMPKTNTPKTITEHDYATSRARQDFPAYASMVQSVDESVGRIVSHLEKLKIADNTIIIFTSDNGGLCTLPKDKTGPTSNLPLRSGKGWLYEGGIREPMIIKWPGTVKAGSVCDQPVISMDFYPTILEMIEAKAMPDQHKDGLSHVPLLKESGSLKRESIFWHFPHFHGSANRPTSAIRCGNWKLIRWIEDGTIELYNLKDDIGETKDLSKVNIEIASKLNKLLMEKLKCV